MSGFLFLLGMALVFTMGFSFGKHWVEMDLTQGWNGGNWAAYRDAKKRHGYMSVATYCSRLLKLI
jgi:hypothetical protein